MAGRYAHKLQDDPEPCKTSQRDRGYVRGRNIRRTSEERSNRAEKEWAKLEKNLGGIKEMKRLPDAIFVVDPKKERICVQEAHTLGITLIGICDTNCDPEELDYVIPGNDDAIRAVKLIVSRWQTL